MSNVEGSVAVTLVDVVSPSAGVFSPTVLGKAKEEHSKSAAASLVELAKGIMLTAQSRLARESQTVKDLEAQLTAAKKSLAESVAAVGYADTKETGLFGLAAYLGMKSAVQTWCRVNAVVVPSNSDEVWSIPDATGGNPAAQG
jgi:Ni,Fe-hydrogenase III component G